MRRIVDFIHTQNSLACLQIAHAGTFPPSIINVRLANPLLKGRKASTYPPLLTFPRNREGMTEKDGGWQVVAPSPYVYYIILFPTTGLTQMLFYRVAWSETYPNPTELTKEEIKEIVQLFADAARRANEAGFDAIEIHVSSLPSFLHLIF